MPTGMEIHSLTLSFSGYGNISEPGLSKNIPITDIRTVREKSMLSRKNLEANVLRIVR